MVVVVIDNAPEKLRGELTRWLLETKPGVFVGKLSATVREKLWEKVCDNAVRTGALLLYSSDTEQGFRIEMCGDPKRSVIDIDGVQLIKPSNNNKFFSICPTHVGMNRRRWPTST